MNRYRIVVEYTTKERLASGQAKHVVRHWEKCSCHEEGESMKFVSGEFIDPQAMSKHNDGHTD